MGVLIRGSLGEQTGSRPKVRLGYIRYGNDADNWNEPTFIRLYTFIIDKLVRKRKCYAKFYMLKFLKVSYSDF